MSYMFSQAYDFNQFIGSWDLHAVTSIKAMFQSSKFDQSVENWDVSSVTDMSSLFWQVNDFDQELLAWDMSHVTSVNAMFDNLDRNLYDWNLTSLVSCNNFNNIGCDPPRLIAMECVDVCCPTQVQHSNYAVAESLRADIGFILTVECDTSFTVGGDITCSPDTGLYPNVSCVGESLSTHAHTMIVYICSSLHILY